MEREHLQARGTAVHGLSARLGAFSALAGGVAALVGGLVLVGWALDVGVLMRVLPNLVAMNPATAVGFVLAGVALSLLRPGRRPGGSARGAARAIAAGFAFLVCLIGFVKLVQISLGLEVGIDGLLFPRGLEAEAATTGLPNRVAPNTAFNFLLVGTSPLLLDRPTRRGLWPAQWQGRTGRSRTVVGGRRARPSGAAPGKGHQQGRPRVLVQAQGVGERPDGVGVGTPARPALQHAPRVR